VLECLSVLRLSVISFDPITLILAVKWGGQSSPQSCRKFGPGIERDEYGDDVAACWVRCSEWISDGGLRGNPVTGAGRKRTQER